jgi:peroxiredoxin Q/BCP
MARTPRASKVSDAKASGQTKAAKGRKPTAKQAAPAKASTAGRATAAKKSDAKQRASRVEIPPVAKKAAKQKTVLHEQASASKKAAKKTAAEKTAVVEAPAPKKGAKKTATDAGASASKKATKKTARADATASSKKGAKKTTGSVEPASAPKKASKKKAGKAEAPASKKASKKKSADEEAPASKKASKKKSAAAEAPAAKKASKKKPAPPSSEQLAFSMDIDSPATNASSTAARSTPLQPGDRVPDFSLEGDDGQTYSRQGLAGERFVIYFYPKDDTPGCTREACDFRDNRPRFETANVKVLGVSGDSLKSHGRFRSKYELNFPLLADPERAIAQAFGAVGEKKLYGKTSVGVIRSTFLVGPGGVVEKTFSPVKVDGHAEAVLQAIGSG